MGSVPGGYDPRVHTEATAVVARFRASEDARAAYTSLQNAGIDAADIRVGGRLADEVESDTMLERQREQLDRRLGAFVTRSVVVGALLGALVGGVLGVAGGFVAAAIADVSDSRRTLLFVVIVVALAALGSVLGALLSVERTVGFDDTWQLTLDAQHEGDMWLAVRVADEDAKAAVLEAFGGMDPAPVNVQERTTSPEGANTASW
jgi:hypothetical protein